MKTLNLNKNVLIIVAIIIALSQSLYKVDQTQYAILLQLGKPIKDIYTPGLKFKLPFIQNAILFDKRLLEYDSAPAEIITGDKKNLVIDNFARWRITDPLKFYQTVKDYLGAQSRLDDIIYSELRVVLGKHKLIDIVSSLRSEIMEEVTKKSNEIAKKYGIEVVDVRIKRADLPPENERYVFNRMRAERQRQAKKYRSEGMEEALKIKSETDKEKTIILSEAKKKAEIIRGEGDTKAVEIYNNAYGKDKEFFEFFRTLKAYENSFDKKTKFILTPDNKFLKYLK